MRYTVQVTYSAWERQLDVETLEPIWTRWNYSERRRETVWRSKNQYEFDRLTWQFNPLSWSGG